MATEQKLHPRNRHRDSYDFERLCQTSEALAQFVRPTPYGDLSIDFANANAVKALNAALLKLDYQIDYWDIPPHFLCPPIPGRVDYIHYLADLLKATNSNKIPRQVIGLDIGTGASCIYPLLGQRSYKWRFVACDVDPKSIASSQQIIDANNGLGDAISLRLQSNSTHIFNGIIAPEDRFDFTMCNPPFHESLAQAHQGAKRKRNNLGTNKQGQDKLNFGGQKAELWCPGGELSFIKTMIRESKAHQHQVLWFTSLVSKKDNLGPLKKSLKKAGVAEFKVIKMAQGQKISRFLAWTYLEQQAQDTWCKSHF
mgnify:CR=1 FL=1